MQYKVVERADGNVHLLQKEDGEKDFELVDVFEGSLAWEAAMDEIRSSPRVSNETIMREVVIEAH